MATKFQYLNLYVLTHTETYYNRKRIFTGQLDSRLTPLGQKQAKKQGKKLQDKKIDWAFVSPLKRTWETLEYIKASHPQLKVIVDKRLTERDYGYLSGHSKVKYRTAHPGFYKVYHRSYETPPPRGESMIEVEKRVLPALDDILSLMRKQKANAIIVAHNNSVRPIRRYFEKMAAQEMMNQDNYHKIFTYKIKA